MLQRILITPRSLTRGGHPALHRLVESGFQLVFSSPGKQPDESELKSLLPGCVGYLCGVEKVNEGVISVAGELRVISRNGTGVDNIDLEAAKKANVRICRAEGANARGVAELAMSLMLALVRSVPFSDQKIKQGEWERREGIELEGHTLGLIGYGRIGRLVAQFAQGMDMKVIAFDPFAKPDPSGKVELVALKEIFSRADIISLHCPPAADGKPLIDSNAISSMKNGVYIVNTARAGLLGEEAVLAALNSGKISGLATDVFREEPPIYKGLATHSKVISTPHIGGFTKESVSHAVEVAVDNLLEVLRTQKP